KETAAVRSQMLDGLERSHWAERDRLLGALHGVRNRARRQGLRLALLNEEERQHECRGQQHARGEPDQVAIEIAEVRSAVADSEGADERHGDDKAGGGG